MFQCRVEADSISPAGVRLTTFVVTFPRFILAEFNTHRMLSRNAASSRAVPVERRIEQVESNPFLPAAFGRNKKGMQAGEPIADDSAAREAWLHARDAAVKEAKELAILGVHKQLANRLLEPFAWVTVIASATDWNNFFTLRCHPDAQPEFRQIAEMMRGARDASTPDELDYGEWHLPFVTPGDRAGGEGEKVGRNRPARLEWWKWVSAGRCARVSYLTNDGRRDPEADVSLATRLSESVPKHASPFEHVATPNGRTAGMEKGNFRGWRQFRHELSGESVPG